MKKADNQKKSTDKKSARNKILWSVMFIVIAAATIWAVVSQSKSFSVASFGEYISRASKPWLAAAIISTLAHIIFEGEAIVSVCRALGCKTSHGSGYVYSASDIYFSAITPSGTGGQPMCAYFMIKDGIPGTVATAALLVNLTMYTVSIMVIWLFSIIIRPQIFSSFGTLSRVLIAIGFVVQSALTIFYMMLLFKGNLLHKICRAVLHFLCRIKILKNEEKRQSKLDEYMKEYAAYTDMIKTRNAAMAKAFVFNILQRASVIAVPIFVFLASGGKASETADVFAVQCCSIIGSNMVPIPGAMGVTDYIMLDGFGALMSDAVNFELLSRSLSFYICVILCGVTALIKYLTLRNRKKL